MNQENPSQKRSLIATLKALLVGGAMIAGAQQASAAQAAASTDDAKLMAERLKRIQERLNGEARNAVIDRSNGQAPLNDLETMWWRNWGNWHNGGWHNWRNGWHNWGNGWHNWGNGWHNLPFWANL
jgi:rSAM-associated Gly-rich repeat protein